jgi:hypothetical protein
MVKKKKKGSLPADYITGNVNEVSSQRYYKQRNVEEKSY